MNKIIYRFKIGFINRSRIVRVDYLAGMMPSCFYPRNIYLWKAIKRVWSMVVDAIRHYTNRMIETVLRSEICELFLCRG